MEMRHPVSTPTCTLRLTPGEAARIAKFMLDRDSACVAAGLAHDSKTGKPLDGVALLGFITGGWS